MAHQISGTLLSRATVVVATNSVIEDIADHFDYFTTQSRPILLAYLSDERLKHLENVLNSRELASGDSFQNEWMCRCKKKGWQVKSTMPFIFSTSRPDYDARQVFWEHTFRQYFHVLPNHDLQQPPVMALFTDVVRTLKLHVREIIPHRVPWVLQLPHLHRLELHHPSDNENQQPNWTSLFSILTTASRLKEVCFFHGRLNAQLLAMVEHAFHARCDSLHPITNLELVSVKIKGHEAHRQLITLFQQYQKFHRVRISSSISDSDTNQELIDAFLMDQPALQHLTLEHNDILDQDLLGFLSTTVQVDLMATSPTVLNLCDLCLANNAISVESMNVISRATINGVLALKHLELRNNTDLSDDGAHALIPMLLMKPTRLLNLGLCNCCIGLEGAIAILGAIASHQSLQTLDLSHNYFGHKIGNVLADFLLVNHTLERLNINYVGLEPSGCTERLIRVLTMNHSLVALAIGANRLRDAGVVSIVRALSTRSQVKQYEAVDMSGNLITIKGLEDLVNEMTKAMADQSHQSVNGYKRRRLAEHNHPSRLINELSILNNDLSGEDDTIVCIRDQCLQRLKKCVNKLYHNVWTEQGMVYDDEV